MRKRYLALGGAILISGLLVMGAGSYLKYGILKPLGLGQDKTAVELPFLLMTDAGLRFSVEAAMETMNSPSQPTSAAQTHPTEDSTTPAEPTQGPTEPTVGTFPTNTVPTEPTEPIPQTSEPQVTTAPTETTQPPETQPPTQPPTEPTETVPETRPNPEDLDFSQGGVDPSWFDDVLFIGDSRTCGLRNWARQGEADYFCDVGMTVFDVQYKKLSDQSFKSLKLQELLQSKEYGKIIINLGLNEAYSTTESFVKRYGELVDIVRTEQPEATIILHGIMMVRPSKAKEAYYFNISYLQARNEEIAKFADGIDIFYLDPNPDFTGEDGYLLPGYSGDGYHLDATHTLVWADWISHAVTNIPID